MVATPIILAHSTKWKKPAWATWDPGSKQTNTSHSYSAFLDILCPFMAYVNPIFFLTDSPDHLLLSLPTGSCHNVSKWGHFHQGFLVTSREWTKWFHRDKSPLQHQHSPDSSNYYYLESQQMLARDVKAKLSCDLTGKKRWAKYVWITYLMW